MQNFLSVGSKPLIFDLNCKQKTLVYGKNGQGKSCLLDSIVFALYSKTYRNINKPQLANTFNKKNCLVVLEFEVDDVPYVVSRGIEPNIFKIEKNGKEVDQYASNADLQNWFEDQVIKLNLQTFKQICLLGSADYVPFMKLNAQQRREVSEQLTSTAVISAMNRLLKDKQLIVNNQINLLTVKKTGLQSTLQKLHQSMSHNIEQEKIKVTELTAQGREFVESRRELEERIKKLAPLVEQQKTVTQVMSETKSQLSSLELSLSKVDTELRFFSSVKECPTCKQPITDTHAADVVRVLANSNAELKDKRLELLGVISDMQKTLDKINTGLTQRHSMQSEVIRIIAMIAGIKTQIQNLTVAITTAVDDSGQLSNVQVEETRTELADIEQELAQLYSSREVMTFSADMLKDAGIKALVIKQYLPILNDSINKYLTFFEFPVRFAFDETFEDATGTSSKSINYKSLSMGERQRCDLAMLFAWRDVAKARAGVEVNLLLFDEILDSSLDIEGAEVLLDLLDKISDKTCVIVISHKDSIFDKFERQIRIEKVNGFTVAS